MESSRIPISIPARPASHAGWRLVAWSLAAFHVAYVIFVLFGALLIKVWPPVIWLHIAALLWAGGTMFGNLGCAVTTWEKHALRRAGVDPYPEGFLQHHVLRRSFDPAHSRRNHAFLGVFALSVNAIIYWTVLT